MLPPIRYKKPAFRCSKGGFFIQQLDRAGAREAGHLLFTVYRLLRDNPFLRGGEIGALQWDRVDMVKQRVSIDRVIDRIGKENAKLPKM